VGLAAPQVGVNVRLMVFNPDGRTRPGNESILVNPEIVEQLGGKELGEEGCLSFPRIYGDVEVGEWAAGRRCGGLWQGTHRQGSRGAGPGSLSALVGLGPGHHHGSWLTSAYESCAAELLDERALGGFVHAPRGEGRLCR
jgi:hypothetical protein